ncbi:Uncharacterised protein [Streptococcus pneumoniae]|nr:Uncharacterised protein [Streptococcus pneumoniae]
MFSTSSKSFSVTISLGHNADIPSPTRAGVLGITLTTFTFLLKAFSVLSILFPAAIVTMIASFLITSFISLIIDEYRSGLIDKIKISAFLATLLLSVVVVS